METAASVTGSAAVERSPLHGDTEAALAVRVSRASSVGMLGERHARVRRVARVKQEHRAAARVQAGWRGSRARCVAHARYN
jgi:hypothetical protein